MIILARAVRTLSGCVTGHFSHPLQKGFGAILKYDPSLCVLAYCLDRRDVKIKILILKVLNCCNVVGVQNYRVFVWRMVM